MLIWVKTSLVFILVDNTISDEQRQLLCCTELVSNETLKILVMVEISIELFTGKGDKVI